MGGAMDSPRLRQLVLQPTPFCNIDCRYCYLADRKSTARMSLATSTLANIGLGAEFRVGGFAGPVDTPDQLKRLLDCPFAHAHLHGRLSHPALKYFQVLMSPQHVVREAALQCFNVQHSLTRY